MRKKLALLIALDNFQITKIRSIGTTNLPVTRRFSTRNQMNLRLFQYLIVEKTSTLEVFKYQEKFRISRHNLVFLASYNPGVSSRHSSEQIGTLEMMTNQLVLVRTLQWRGETTRRCTISWKTVPSTSTSTSTVWMPWAERLCTLRSKTRISRS